jgi:glutamate-1-semialdehyde aminotransferase
LRITFYSYFEKALQLIPWATQTNAKRPYPFFDEVMPKFIQRGKGCHIWDMEGKVYIDYRLGLGPVTLGYCYDEVDDAVRAQMQKGVLFSMASPIELDLAQLLHEIIRQHNEQLACAVAVPYDLNEDTSGDYIRLLRKLTKEYGIILVLDEVLTGFRLVLGGAQEYFGGAADLASYAKAMANGYPISTYLGERQYMEQLNKFKITTTYAGS